MLFYVGLHVPAHAKYVERTEMLFLRRFLFCWWGGCGGIINVDHIDVFWLCNNCKKRINAKDRSVPIVGRGTLHEFVRWGERGFISSWGNFQAEGLVARPSVELRDRDGSRIITKIKHKDFSAVNVPPEKP